MRHVVERMADLAAATWWQAFVHGVLNTDNMNVTGEKLRLWPVGRWLPTWDPGFTAAYFDHAGLYAFGRQPEALHWNCGQFAVALRLLTDSAPLIAALERFGPLYMEAVARRWMLGGVGVEPQGEEQDTRLVSSCEAANARKRCSARCILLRPPRRTRRGNRRAGQGVGKLHTPALDPCILVRTTRPQSMLIDGGRGDLGGDSTRAMTGRRFTAKVDALAPHGRRGPWGQRPFPRRSRRTGIAVCAWIVPKPAFTLSFQLGAHYPPAVVPGGTDRGKTGAVTDKTLVSYEPASGEELWRGLHGDVDAAVSAARRAWPAWAARPLGDRIAALRAFSNEVRRECEPLAELIAREAGKPLWEARSEVDAVVNKVDIAVQAYAERTGKKKIRRRDQRQRSSPPQAARGDGGSWPL